jgi:hypothetical protein
MRVHLRGVGFAAPGLRDWDAARAVLAGAEPWVEAPLEHAVPEALPAAERRRAGPLVRLAVAVAQEAVARAKVDAAELASVFASADGDGENVHQICTTLASAAPELSPTRFHNSVQNAASGYWSIAMRAPAPTTTVNALDDVFATGLLEAATQVAAERRDVLLVAYDLPMPGPLASLHPVGGGCGVAMVLGTRGRADDLASIEVALADLSAATPMRAPALEPLRNISPPARALPLLAAVACGASTTLVLGLDEHNSLRVEVHAGLQG